MLEDLRVLHRLRHLLDQRQHRADDHARRGVGAQHLLHRHDAVLFHEGDLALRIVDGEALLQRGEDGENGVLGHGGLKQHREQRVNEKGLQIHFRTLHGRRVV